MSRELFSEKQATEILQRAIELQESAGDPDKPYSPGVTEEELAAIARESGIDIDFLRQAMKDVRERGFRPKAASPNPDTFEYVLEGELPVEHRDVLMEVAPPYTTTGVAVTTVGQTTQYLSTRGGHYVRVSASARGGRTRLSLQHDPSMAVLAGILPSFFLSIFGLILGLRFMGPLGLIWPILFIGAGWYFYKFLRNKGRAHTAQLAETMRDRVTEELERQNLAAKPLTVIEAQPLPLEERLSQGDSGGG
jgi:hypothetical protein